MNKKKPAAALLYLRSFWGLMLRDFRVLRREFVAFLIRTVMNPLLFVFVFTYLFPKIGQGVKGVQGVSFGTILLPGLIAVGIFFQGIMAVALPLSQELGATREIHDRVMAPLPVALVAVEKIVFSALQSVLAADCYIPASRSNPASSRTGPHLQLATVGDHGAARGSNVGRGGTCHRHNRKAPTDRINLWCGGGPGNLSRLCVLSLGGAVPRALAQGPGSGQPGRLYVRRITRRAHRSGAAHAGGSNHYCPVDCAGADRLYRNPRLHAPGR